MKIATWILIGALATLTVSAASASADGAKKTATKKTAKKVSALKKSSPGQGKSLKSGSQANSKLSRDVVFDGAMVNGQYHSAGEAVTKVEQEKQMNDLIGMRRDFKDRLTAERERLKKGEAASAQ
jgi:hypothetical protein